MSQVVVDEAKVPSHDALHGARLPVQAGVPQETGRIRPQPRPQGSRKRRKGENAAAPDLVGGRPHLEGRGPGRFPATRPAAGPRRSARGGHGQRPVHRGQKVRDTLPDLRKQNLHLYYLPPYSPELNNIERMFRKAMPRRLQPHERALLAAVHACFRDLRDQLSS